jgi:uncharacterized protein YbjT (DUF2867 family)
MEGIIMKIVVIGGGGLIGSKVVSWLRRKGHDAIAASPRTGVNTVTGEGLIDALAGARAVIDVANSPSLDDHVVMAFFQASGRNLLAAEAVAGVRHHIALSIVGADRLPQSGYLRAKAVQEDLIQAAGIPYTILRSTQFFEFAGAIAQSASDGRSVRLPVAPVQPVAAEDVSALLARIAAIAPTNMTIEMGGPELMPMDEFVRRYLESKWDRRPVVGDPQARYFGARLDDGSLTPGRNPLIGSIRFDEWLNRALAAA